MHQLEHRHRRREHGSFGDLHSGNHRRRGLQRRFCAYPVASMVERGADAAVPAGMQVDLSDG